MRDIILKNLTSLEKKRRIVSSSETINQNGVNTQIRRYFICNVQEVQGEIDKKPTPRIYVYKYHDTKESLSRFFYKLKGSIYLVNNNQVYLVNYIHSFRLNLSPVTI